MSSLWTPGGEHEVPREPAAPREEASPSEPSMPHGEAPAAESVEDLPGFDELTPDEQAQARAMAAELAQARERLAQTPAADVIANHAMGMYELAAIHLSGQPPALTEARLAVDAMAAVLQAVQGRLGENEPVLRDALQQLQIVYVQLADGAGEDDG